LVGEGLEVGGVGGGVVGVGVDFVGWGHDADAAGGDAGHGVVGSEFAICERVSCIVFYSVL